jgi:LPS sulfotransferase NodH
MKPFVVLGTQRTGTTLIRTSLDSHSDVRCHGELFVVGRWPHRFTRERPYTLPDGYWSYRQSSIAARVGSVLTPSREVIRFLDRLYSCDDIAAVGFKLMLTEARRFPQVVDYLKERKVPAIHILRRNLLETLISRRVARATGVYHRTDGEQPGESARPNVEPRVRFDASQLARAIQALSNEDQAWQDLIYGHIPVHRVHYEDFVLAGQVESDKMLRFLGVEPHPLSSPLRKVVTSDWRRLVADPQMVEDTLRRIGFGHLVA